MRSVEYVHSTLLSDGVSFENSKGEIVGFIGPNGAGKSTTMKIITGYIPPTSWKVYVNGMRKQAKKLVEEIIERCGLTPECHKQIIEIRKLISELGKEKTVILSTHILQEIEAICDRVIIIYKGKIVADEPMAGQSGKKLEKKFRELTGV